MPTLADIGTGLMIIGDMESISRMNGGRYQAEKQGVT